MKQFSFLTWYRNISIAKKLYFAVGTMAFLILIELFTLWFSISTLSSVRAFVGGEGLWSKGQKDAIYNLRKYVRSGNEKDYQEYLAFLKVPLGDRITRHELGKANPDHETMRRGFIQGGNHPDDVDGMIHLFSRFHRISYISKAIQIWGKADSLLADVQKSADRLHSIILVLGMSSPEKIEDNLVQIDKYNAQLTILEDDFSAALGEGSRWLENMVLKILLSIAITVELSGILLGISVSLTITKGIKEVIRIASKISNADFSERARVFSKDEIGDLSNSFNKMIDELETSSVTAKKDELLIQQKSEDLARSNKELEQFAYVASHDLQEPLRIITSYVQLLEKRYKGKIDKDADIFIHFTVDAAARMHSLINDLLTYSRVGTLPEQFQKVDCMMIVKNVLENLRSSIKETNAHIKFDKLPVINGDASQMTQLFQNLIGNAIKFKDQKTPDIKIAVKDEISHWLFSVKDNSIGIKKEYIEKIFIIFQRLHTIAEYPGTGIGLAICKKIVERHGGKIWAESEEGKGATFFFTIKK